MKRFVVSLFIALAIVLPISIYAYLKLVSSPVSEIQKSVEEGHAMIEKPELAGKTHTARDVLEETFISHQKNLLAVKYKPADGKIAKSILLVKSILAEYELYIKNDKTSDFIFI